MSYEFEPDIAGARSLMAVHHPGPDDRPGWCPICTSRTPCDTYDMAETVVVLADLLAGLFPHGFAADPKMDGSNALRPSRTPLRLNSEQINVLRGTLEAMGIRT